MGLRMVLVLVVMIMGGLLIWRYTRSRGYGPVSGLGLILLIVLLLVLGGNFLGGF